MFSFGQALIDEVTKKFTILSTISGSHLFADTYVLNFWNIL